MSKRTLEIVLRPAVRSDIPGMHAVRMSVTENRLVSTVITEADYVPAIEGNGRGWVMEAGGPLAVCRRNASIAVIASRAAARQSRDARAEAWIASSPPAPRNDGCLLEADGRIVGFAIGNAENGNIWALFVEPGHERRGYGRQLLEAVVEWLWSQGLQRLWLTTGPGTRAQGFYEAAGWRGVGLTAQGELRFELHRPERAG